MRTNTAPVPTDAPVHSLEHQDAVTPFFLTYEGVLWILISFVTLLIRVWYLDMAPLTNNEAANAINSLAIIHGDGVIALNPLFSSLQSLIMSLFGASDYSARLPSAIAGTLLCLAPLLMREQLGRWRALLFTMFLALSPTLWFASRQGEGALLAWLIAFSAWLSWRRGSIRMTAICIGLLMACGQDAVGPLIVSGLCIAFSVFTVSANRPIKRPERVTWRAVVLGAVAFGIASTGLLWRPSGLGDAFNGLALWLQHIFTPGPLGFMRMLAGIIIYEPLILLSGGIGMGLLLIKRRLNADDVVWLIWITAGLLLLALNQSRNASDLTPVVIGSAALAALTVAELIQSLTTEMTNPWRAEVIIACLTSIMLIYGYLGLSMYAAQRQNAWLISILLAALMIAGIGVVATLTHGTPVAIRGIGIGILACLLVYTLSTGYQLTQVRAMNPAEAYVGEASVDNLRLLINTIETTSTRAYGDPDSLPLQVVDSAPPALRWALRNQRKVSYVSRLGDTPAALTPINERPPGTDVYIGNAFRISSSASLATLRCQPIATATEQLDCTSVARWLTLRVVDETMVTRWIFWLRSDIAQKASGH